MNVLMQSPDAKESQSEKTALKPLEIVSKGGHGYSVSADYLLLYHRTGLSESL